MGKKLTMLAASEMILSMEGDPCYYFEPVEKLFAEADLVFGHLEAPHTDRPNYQGQYIAPAAPMKNIVGLKYAHFDAVTLAGNPTFSYGEPGVEDTIKWLEENGIGHVGAGMNIDEARRPLILEREGVKFGFLSYDSTAFRSAANPAKAGAAYVDIITYHRSTSFPGGRPTTMTFIEPWSLEAMREDIRALRSKCDILTVVLHKGLGFSSELADYEYLLPRHAIDEGADLIVANHSHVLKPVEFYKDVPIYHCLGNLVCVFPWEVHSMFHVQPETTLGKSKVRPRGTGAARAILDPDAPNYPFPSKEAMIGKIIVDVDEKKIVDARILPLYINNEGQPIVHGRDDKGETVLATMERVTAENGLNGKYKWDGDEIVCYSDGPSKK